MDIWSLSTLHPFALNRKASFHDIWTIGISVCVCVCVYIYIYIYIYIYTWVCSKFCNILVTWGTVACPFRVSVIHNSYSTNSQSLHFVLWLPCIAIFNIVHCLLLSFSIVLSSSLLARGITMWSHFYVYKIYLLLWQYFPFITCCSIGISEKIWNIWTAYYEHFSLTYFYLLELFWSPDCKHRIWDTVSYWPWVQ